MKKNIVIVLLSTLSMLFGVYGYKQKIRADENEQRVIALEKVTLEMRTEVEQQRELARQQMEMAVLKRRKHNVKIRLPQTHSQR